MGSIIRGIVPKSESGSKGPGLGDGLPLDVGCHPLLGVTEGFAS
jgi:hypothetical protein